MPASKVAPMPFAHMLKMCGLTLEEAEKILSKDYNKQHAFSTSKFRLKARSAHPDKGGSHEEMRDLQLSREWLVTAQRIRDALVSFINTERSIRERDLKRQEEEARREALKRKMDNI